MSKGFYDEDGFLLIVDYAYRIDEIDQQNKILKSHKWKVLVDSINDLRRGTCICGCSYIEDVDGYTWFESNNGRTMCNISDEEYEIYKVIK